MPAPLLPFLLRETKHPDPELTPTNFWLKQLSAEVASYMLSDSLYALISPGTNQFDLIFSPQIFRIHV
jgi:hypothetical protein